MPNFKFQISNDCKVSDLGRGAKAVYRIISYDDIVGISPELYLSEGELKELAQKDERKREGWLASRYAVKEAVKELVPDVEITHIEVGHLDSGAPVLLLHSGVIASPKDEAISSSLQKIATADRAQPRNDGDFSLPISLSHGSGYGAAVVSRQPGRRIGVDIERVREWKDETLRAFLTEGEYGEVMAVAGMERNRLATKYWSAKEAYLKALGVGLRRHPSTVEVNAAVVDSMAVDKDVLVAVSLLYGNECCA